MKTIEETDVLLNFAEDCSTYLLIQENIKIEFPAGSWAGDKKRNIADIHGDNIPNIEAKSNFVSAKKDYENTKKNINITHYIYSSPDVNQKQIDYWLTNKINAAIYITSVNKWFLVITNSDNWLRKLLSPEKVIN